MKKGLINLASVLVKIILLPLWCIGWLIPKNKNIWIFGSNNGKKYSDNSKALFEYTHAHKEQTKIRPIWLTRNNKVLARIKQEGREVYLFYSWEGIYFSLVAKVLVISHSFADLNLTAYLFHQKSKVIQLWHGTPLKNIEIHNHFSLVENLLLWLFLTYLGRHHDLIISGTDLNVPIYARMDNFHRATIKVTGQPRTDYLFQQRAANPKKTLLYLPTWREEDNLTDLFQDFDIQAFEKVLAENNATLLIKLHPLDERKYSGLLGLFAQGQSIQVSRIDDVYELLLDTDILLTDYSSVYFDFLLLDRPMIFTPFDLKQYESVWGFYYDYDLVTPGPKAKNWSEVLTNVKELLSGTDSYQAQRHKVRDQFNKFIDAQSSARVYQEIIDLLR